MAAAQTGASGHYPLLVKNATYCPNNTFYVKTGDIVSVTVTNGDSGFDGPGEGGVRYNDTVYADDPDPTSPSMPPYTSDSGQAFTYTVTSAAEDISFEWWFYGGPATGGAYTHSQSVKMNRVSGTLAASSSTVDQGGTTTFSVSSLSGLLTTSGNANNLYISVFKDTAPSTLVSVHTYTGGGWDSSATQLGAIKTTDTSTVLTVGSNMPTGTYKAYLTHFNAADSPGGNDFFGSEHRLNPSGLAFTVNEPDDDEPTASSFDFPDISNAATSALIESQTMTPSGYNTAATVLVQSGGERAFRIDGGTWYAGGTTNQQISPTETLQLRMRSSASNDAVLSTTVSIGGVSSTTAWTVTTEEEEGDEDPNAFSFDDTSQSVSTEKISNSVTLAGYDTATTITALASGTTVSINGGSFTSTIGTAVPTSASIRIKITTGSSYSTPYTGRVSVGTTQSSLWTVTTYADSSGIDVGPAGSANYGLQIINDSSNIIFGPELRATNFVAVGVKTGITAGQTVSVTGIEEIYENNSTDILISIHCTDSLRSDTEFIEVTRTDGGFTLKNNSESTRSVRWLVMRV